MLSCPMTVIYIFICFNLQSIYKELAMIICVMARAVIIRVGTKPRRVFPGRKESLGGASPKKYLKDPDLVIRMEMVVEITIGN